MKLAVNQKTPSRWLLGISESVWIAFFLAAATLAVYHPVAGFGFVNFDDPLWVSENPMVRNGFSLDAFLWSFTRATEKANYWVPVTWLSLFFDRVVYGMDAGGYHFTNLLLHIANTLLVFFCLKRISGAIWPSGFVAALFALHPLHVESVAWITERKDVLSAFFWMLSIWVYAWYARKPGIKRYMLLVFVFMLGIMSKPMMLTLPLVLLLLDYWPLNRLSGEEPATVPFFGRPVREKVPLFLLVIGIGAVTWMTQAKGGAIKPLSEIPMDTRVANTLMAYVWYLKKMFWPVNLAVIYPYPHAPSMLGAMLNGAVLALITALAAWCRRSLPFVAVGWLWYLITLAPASGLVVIGPHAVADRYSYIPLIGIFIALAWTAATVMWRWRAKGWVFGCMAIAFIPVLLSMGLSYRQVATWKDSVTLFSRALEVTSGNVLAHNNLGYALASAGETREAIVQFDRVLVLNPKSAQAYNGRGNMRLETGDPRGALADYNRAMVLDMDFADPLNGAGNALTALGQSKAAVVNYRKAIVLNPDFAQAHNNLGLALTTLGQTEAAIDHFRRALALRPDFAAARVNFGNVLSGSDRPDEAVAQFKAVLAMNPDTAQAAYSMAMTMEKKGDVAAATRWYLRTLRIDPGFSPAANNIGVILARTGRPAKAVRFFRKALNHAPEDMDVRENLRRAEAAAGRKDP
ncbi:MAG: tetratricopeptide repeat protein [Desulfobacterales bacterium]|nr:tetratricopeptide repeat protein [Desulfobacterales bacterium]